MPCPWMAFSKSNARANRERGGAREQGSEGAMVQGHLDADSSRHVARLGWLDRAQIQGRQPKFDTRDQLAISLCHDSSAATAPRVQPELTSSHRRLRLEGSQPGSSLWPQGHPGGHPQAPWVPLPNQSILPDGRERERLWVLTDCQSRCSVGEEHGQERVPHGQGLCHLRCPSCRRHCHQPP